MTGNIATLHAIVAMEAGLAVACGSIPTCKPLLAQTIPILFAPCGPSSHPIPQTRDMEVSSQIMALQIPRKTARPGAHHLEYLEADNWLSRDRE